MLDSATMSSAAEMDSFYFKFKRLVSAGIKAELTIDADNGEAIIGLKAKLGHLEFKNVEVDQCQSPRYRGPSYFRRQKRRHEERKNEQTSTVDTVVTKKEEKVDSVCDAAVKAMCKQETKRSAAEVVSDDNLENPEAATAVDLDEIEARERAREEKEEASKDRNVEQVVISSVTEPMESKLKVEEEIKFKFGRIGVTVKDMMTTTKNGKFQSSLVNVTPTNLKRIWGRRLGLDNCSIIAYEKPP